MVRLTLVIAIALALTAGAFGGLAGAPPADAGSLGGPVILGGDDLTDHGCIDGAGDPVLGWLYIQRALENIGPNVSRSNDGSIAALGSSAAAPGSCGNAGSAIGVAAGEVGRTVTYYDGGAAINQFFTDLGSGAVSPAIIWIAGDQASNDLSGDEPAALVANAANISSFVNSGGGLMSHGTEYGWLSALLPGVTTVDGGSSDDLYFTAEGAAELSPLTLDDINAGPWHNYFEGDFGGLQVLVRSSNRQDSSGQDAAVILGGAQVTIIEQPVEEAEPTPGDCIPALPGYSCGGEPGRGVSPDTPVPTEPVEEPTVEVAPATVVPQPVSTVAGVITAPDTGDGSGSAGGGTATPWMVALAIAVLTAAGGGLMATAARRR